MNAEQHHEDKIPSVTAAAAGAIERRRPRRPRVGGARSGKWLSAAILIVIVILAGLAQTSAGRRATALIGVRNEREPFTALAFLNPGTLGSAGVFYTGAVVHDHVAFVITNAEHHALHYGWTVDFNPAGRLYRGSVFLRSGASSTVSQTVLVPCDANVTPARRHLHTITVRVSLRPSRESIDFQQECDG
jgi:hypothetical protein